MSFGDLKVQDLIYEDSSNNEITVVIADLATKANPTFTGTVTVPTAPASDVSTKAASTAFVDAYYATKAAPAFTGSATGVNLTLSGNLVVNGTTTTINTQTLDVEDINITLGKVSTPSDTTANNGGITLKGASDKTFNWLNATDAWTSSEHLHLLNGKNLILGTDSRGALGYNSSTSIVELANRNTYLQLSDNGTAAGSILFKVDDGNQFFINDRGFVGPGLGTVGMQWTPAANQDTVLGVRGRGSDTSHLAVVDLTSSQPSVSGADVKYGKIRFSWDNTSWVSDNGTAMIEGCSGAASSSTDRATALKFYTAPTGSAGSYAALPVERLRIWKDGQIGIGGANYGSSGQVLTSGGSGAAPSWTTISAAPEITATASGAIAANKAVIVNSNGTISEVGETTSPASLTEVAEVLSASGASVDPDDIKWIKDDTFIAVWKRFNDSNITYIVAGTISGSTITLGTPVYVNSNVAHVGQRIAVDRINETFMWIGYDNAADRLRFKGGKVTSGTTIAMGSDQSLTVGGDGNACAIESGNGTYCVVFYKNSTGTTKHYIMGVDLTNNYGIVYSSDGESSISVSAGLSDTYSLAYDEVQSKYLLITRGNSNNLRASWITSNGTSSAPTVWADSSTLLSDSIDPNVVYDSYNNKFVLTYHKHNGGDWDPTAVVLTASGASSSPSKGTEFELESITASRMRTAYVKGAKKIAVIRSGISSIKIQLLTVSGTSLSSVSTTTIDNLNRNRIGIDAHESSNRIVSIFRDDGASGSGTYPARFEVWDVPNTSPNVTTENFIGFSTAAISDTASGTVAVTGNTTTQSSLTAGQKYYVQNNGTLGLTAADPSVEAGIALSSTKLLIKG